MAITIVFPRNYWYLYLSEAWRCGMGVTREAASENRQKILASAEKLFREKGVDAVGLAELMKEAGFTTQGGFYNHFKSKEALVAEVLSRAVEDGVKQLATAVATSQAQGIDPLPRQIDWYLSTGQRDDIECGCSMAGFAGDVRRLTKEAQVSYAEALGRTFDQLADLIRFQAPDISKGTAHAKAIALYSQMIGSLLLSRAVSSGDPALSNDILKQSRADLIRKFPQQSKPRRKSAR
jgi:TetR/AcrR family transcriptional regulator, transcriptional repressor for nem operon